MLRVAFRIVGNQADAEDVRQAVLTRIWQRPDSLPKAKQLPGWIHRCVTNESIDTVRRLQRERSRNQNMAPSQHEYVEPFQPAGPSDESEQLKQALQGLSLEQRAILALRFDEQMTVRQIAEVMQQPHTTVHAKLTRGIHELRSKLLTKRAER